MSGKTPAHVDLPSSYPSLSWQHIRVSHIPESAPTPTRVILVTLYRPENNNAFTHIMMAELEKMFALLSIDDRVKAVVLSGYGNRIFSAGADLDIGFAEEKSGARNEKNERGNGHRDGYVKVRYNTRCHHVQWLPDPAIPSPRTVCFCCVTLNINKV